MGIFFFILVDIYQYLDKFYANTVWLITNKNCPMIQWAEVGQRFVFIKIRVFKLQQENGNNSKYFNLCLFVVYSISKYKGMNENIKDYFRIKQFSSSNQLVKTVTFS